MCVKRWDTDAWLPSLVGHKEFGRVCDHDIQLVRRGANRLYAITVGGRRRALWYMPWGGEAWGEWVNLGGEIWDSAAAVSWSFNRIDIFCVAGGQNLYHKYLDGSSWSEYHTLNAKCHGPPVAISRGENQLDLFYVTSDSSRSLHYKSFKFRKTQWLPLATGTTRNLGGPCSGPPAVVSWSPERLDVFVIDNNGALSHKWWDGQTWYPPQDAYELLGGSFTSRPAAVSWGPDRLDVFALDRDGVLHHLYWNGVTWKADIHRLGKKFTKYPTVITSAPNRIDVFLVGEDMSIYHTWWDGRSRFEKYEHMEGHCLSVVTAVVAIA